MMNKMDSESESDSEIESEIPIFDGKFENFQVWWTRFRAHSAVCKFKEALKIGGETSMPITEAKKCTPTMDSAAESRSVRLPIFDGTHNKFQVFGGRGLWHLRLFTSSHEREHNTTTTATATKRVVKKSREIFSRHIFSPRILAIS
jgi:hypothetical protein